MPASIIKSLFPQTVETISSQYNGKISVQYFIGRYSIVSGDLTQSGGLVEHIWKKGIKYTRKHIFANKHPQQILILGLGAGSLVKYLEFNLIY